MRTRHFLGWSKPLLEAAADWLIDRFGKDMAEATVVLPTARAGRRLEAILVQRLGAMARPQMVTVGQLPDMVLPKAVKENVASDLVVQLGWLSALQAVGAERLKPLVPDPPKPEDFRSWQSLTGRLVQLRQDLSAGLKTLEDVAQVAEEDLQPDAARWACLAAIESIYEATLNEHGWVDPVTARLQASQAIEADGGVMDGMSEAASASLADAFPGDDDPLARFDPAEADGDYDDAPEWGRTMGSYASENEDTYEATADNHAGNATHAGDWQQVDTPVVLVGVADLNRLQRQALSAMADVSVLVFAAESQADRFDGFGGLLVERWAHEPLALQPGQLRLVEKHADEALAAVEQIALATCVATDGVSTWTEDDVAVGLGDETQHAAVQRAIEAAGGRARSAVGRPLTQTGPCLFLQAAANFLAAGRLPALSELVRHPDVHVALASETGVLGHTEGLQANPDAEAGLHTNQPASHAPNHPAPTSGGGGWVAVLDGHVEQSLQVVLEGVPKESVESGRLLLHLGEWVRGLFEIDGQAVAFGQTPMGLAEASRSMWAALTKLYAGRAFRPHEAAEQATVVALTALGEALQAQMDEALPEGLVPVMGLPQAIDWTLARLGQQAAADPPERGAVELMGVLDVFADDAKVAVMTAVNEGFVPKTSVADPFLPDSLRRRLGLPDAHQRVARDNYLLHAMQGSKETLVLVASKTGANGDPMPPSRLLLQGEVRETAECLQAFYGDDAAPALQTVAASNKQKESRDKASKGAAVVASGGGGASGSVWPVLPVRQDAALGRMAVTAFRDYLACPYRFYLKRVLRLKTQDDAKRELDPPAFGNLLHDTLGELGRDDAPSTSDDAGLVKQFLMDELSTVARNRYGHRPRAAVRVQVAFAAERLETFAVWQAKRAGEGWVIDQVESDFEHTFETPAGAMTVHGRMDRIDTHPSLGVCLMDYKTADKVKSPDRVHFKGKTPGQRTWLDLQLPLYRALWLAQQLDALGGDVSRLPAPPSLGYVLLPKKAGDVQLAMADWDEQDWKQARRVRERVIEQVLGQCFWPPSEPSGSDDGFKRLCADDWPERAAWIQSQTAQVLSQGIGLAHDVSDGLAEAVSQEGGAQ